MYKIENPLRNYAWGSTTAIADLLGRTPSGGPEAELWIGAHPDSPSTVVGPDTGAMGLDELISSDPERTLGPAARAEFGDRLPFLVKILAASAPLSLQVHPNLSQAREGFAAENGAGVPQDAPHRNYRDDNHKPEMIFALTPFQALSGFRPVSESVEVFSATARLIEQDRGWVPTALTAVISDLGIPDPSRANREAFVRLLGGGAETKAVVDVVVSVLEATDDDGGSSLLREARNTVLELSRHYPGDPGVLVALLLNRVSLAEGEAMCLSAGQMHAYLSGLGVEVMASSDNVLRGGLTAKHVDVPELVRVCDFAPRDPELVTAQITDASQELYRPPFREFQLQRIELEAHGGPVPVAQHGPALVISVRGDARLDSPKSELRLLHGESAFLPVLDEPVLAHPLVNNAETALLFAVTLSGESDEYPAGGNAS